MAYSYEPIVKYSERELHNLNFLHNLKNALILYKADKEPTPDEIKDE